MAEKKESSGSRLQRPDSGVEGKADIMADKEVKSYSPPAFKKVDEDNLRTAITEDAAQSTGYCCCDSVCSCDSVGDGCQCHDVCSCDGVCGSNCSDCSNTYTYYTTYYTYTYYYYYY